MPKKRRAGKLRSDILTSHWRQVERIENEKTNRPSSNRWRNVNSFAHDGKEQHTQQTAIRNGTVLPLTL